ncbi:MAG TPA: dihydroorotate dehydrogenase-like protein [Anaerolineae bacterium]|nr:dihydroorotate dehydrogenase-like protein [Anaerolineae bacterium]
MIDLSTTYLGMNLRNPLMPSASPLSKSIDTVKRLEDHGAAAVVMYSLFEEQITHESDELDHYLSYGTESYVEATSYFPDLAHYNLGPQEYLEHIRKAKAAVDIPIIGSLNGVSSGGWIRYAKLIQEAGADALELNVYFIPTDPAISSANVENMYLDLVQQLKGSVRIPVAVKLTHFFSSLPHVASRLDQAGADALVLFNRFYQPDIDLENLDVVTNLSLSSSYELRLRLRWAAILFGNVKADLAITGGVHTAEDVLKCMMVGAKVAQMASVLLHNGVHVLDDILIDLRRWLETHEYESIKQMQGSMSQRNVAQPAAFERANYMKVLNSFEVKVR